MLSEDIKYESVRSLINRVIVNINIITTCDL